jgi:hypothetical protein
MSCAESGSQRLAELHKLIPPCRVPDGRSGDWYIETRGAHKHLGYPRYNDVMNDTIEELALHETFVRAASGKILITGLGLGLLPTALLLKPDVTRIDVVEIEPDVIALVGPHLQDDRLHIHQGDAYTWLPPAGTQFDFAWHDLIYWDEPMSVAIRRLREHYRPYALAQLAWAEGQPWWV